MLGEKFCPKVLLSVGRSAARGSGLRQGKGHSWEWLEAG